MTRASKIVVAILAVLVVAGAFALPSLRRAVERLSGNPGTEEQARREMLQAPISTPTDVNVKAQMYWLAPGSSTALAPETVELPLSADPVERSKQLLQALIVKAPSPDRRTLPPDATLLAFYIDPEGTAIADFSDELSQNTASGILSEQLAVDSITQTLGASVQSIQKLKILIHGQEVDTLAGHIDLSVFFPVPHAIQPAAPATPANGIEPAAPNPASPQTAPAPQQTAPGHAGANLPASEPKAASPDTKPASLAAPTAPITPTQPSAPTSPGSSATHATH